MTLLKPLLRGTTLAAALTVAFSMIQSDPVQALPNADCWHDGMCAHCWSDYGSYTCASVCGVETCWEN